jgi:hypothetical protein
MRAVQWEFLFENTLAVCSLFFLPSARPLACRQYHTNAQTLDKMRPGNAPSSAASFADALLRPDFNHHYRDRVRAAA